MHDEPPFPGRPFAVRVSRALLLAALPACASQCDDTLPSEAELCFDDVVCDPDMPAGAADVGERFDGHFTSWDGDETVEVVAGGQGGYMILPTVCVPAPAGATSDVCLLLRLDNVLDAAVPDAGADADVDDDGGIQARYQFHKSGERLCAGPIYDLLTYSTIDLAGGGVTLDADVCGADLHGAVTRHVGLSQP